MKSFLKRSGVLFFLKDVEIQNFIRRYYALLEAANPPFKITENDIINARTSYERSNREKQLEALARLTVGNEVCSAVAFDNSNLLFATNKKAHQELIIRYSVELEVDQGLFLDCRMGRLILKIQFGDNPSISVPCSQKVFYFPSRVFNGYGRELPSVVRPYVLKDGKSESQDMSTFRREDYDLRFEFNFEVPPELHGILDLPEISIKITLNEIPLSLLGRGIQRIPHPILSATSLKDCCIAVDPLRRRAEILVEHLSFVINAHRHPNRELEQRAAIAAERNRFRILMNSLVWEIVEWYEAILSKEARKLAEKGNKKIAEDEKSKEHPSLQKLVEQLNDHFSEFKRKKKQTSTTLQLIEEWATEIDAEIKKEKSDLSVPIYVKENPEKFTKRMKKYFKDLETLENFIRQDFDNKGRLSETIASVMLDKRNVVEIVGDLEDGVHAEVRLLWRSISNKKTLNYIACSKYSCVHCALMFYQHGHRIPGVHGKIFGTWTLSSELQSENFLKPLLGDDLYFEYQRLCTIPTKGPDGKTLTIGQAVISVIQSLGILSKEDIVYTFKVGSGRFDNKEEDYASDEEEIPIDIKLRKHVYGSKKSKPNRKNLSLDRLQEQTNKYAYTCYDVKGDGNCLYHAVVDQLKYHFRVNINHLRLREMVCDHVLSNIGFYSNFIENDEWDSLGREGTWGDALDIRAISRIFNVNLVIVRNDGNQPNIFKRNSPLGTLYLGYQVNSHYLSLRPLPCGVATSNIDDLIVNAETDTHYDDNDNLIIRELCNNVNRKNPAPFPALLCLFGLRKNKVTGPRVADALEKLAEKEGNEITSETAEKFIQWSKKHNRHFNLQGVKKWLEQPKKACLTTISEGADEPQQQPSSSKLKGKQL